MGCAVTVLSDPKIRGIELRQCGLTAACAMVARWHRHLPRCIGGLVAAELVRVDSGWPVGVAIIGRPVSRELQAQGWCEVTRVALAPRGDGPLDCPWGAASLAYRWAEAWAWWGGMPVTSYTLDCEDGGSLRAAGWVPVATTQGGQWGRPARPRRMRSGVAARRKVRWVPASLVAP